MLVLKSIKQKIKTFTTNIEGAATVDFVMLTAAVVIVSFSAISGLGTAITAALLKITLG